jgi:hypothetical protein
MRRLLTALILAAALPAAAAEIEEPESFPDKPGRDDTFYTCIACHNFKLVAAQGMSRERWSSTLDWMTERHGMMELDAEQRETILAYLAEAFPPRAPAAGAGWRNPFLKN